MNEPSPASSLLGRNWALREADERRVAAMVQQLGIPEVVARVLAGRGVAPEDAPHFLQPTLKHFLPDPFHLRDMDKAANRLADAVQQGETIGIFGDYDVDGATSSALLQRFFNALRTPSLVYIPDRMKEGYGPNAPALRKLKELGASVALTVDCGTLAFAPLAEAKQAGLDVIVVDHHQGEAKLPVCFALINPNRMDETSEHRQLAAVGVAFLLVVAVNKTLRERGYYSSPAGGGKGGGRTRSDTFRPPPDLPPAGGGVFEEPNLLQWLDIVALGTICDVVPLVGVNRALVKQGLAVLAARGSTGLRALAEVAALKEAPGAYHAGFVLGPRINAGGRVGQSDLGVRLLTTENDAEALELARTLDHYNRERQAIEQAVLEEAFAMAEAQRAGGAPFVLVASEGWHAGVIGIVAGRLKERYHCPAAVVALEGATGKASARSVTGFDLGAAVIAAVEKGLLVSGGGHAMAAGFTVEAARMEALHRFLNERYAAGGHGQDARAYLIDGYVALSALTPQLAEQIEQASPFGSGNAMPRFAVSGVLAAHTQVVGQNHVRVVLSGGRDDPARFSAIAFRAADNALGKFLLSPKARAVPFTVAGTIKTSVWQGRERAEFHIEDAQLQHG